MVISRAQMQKEVSTGSKKMKKKLKKVDKKKNPGLAKFCLLYTSPSPRDRQKSRMPSSA